jgi:hypothetical protein
MTKQRADTMIYEIIIPVKDFWTLCKNMKNVYTKRDDKNYVCY